MDVQAAPRRGMPTYICVYGGEGDEGTWLVRLAVGVHNERADWPGQMADIQSLRDRVGAQEQKQSRNWTPTNSSLGRLGVQSISAGRGSMRYGRVDSEG